MCCEQLVCARCAGRVSEGNCSTCRAARAELHHGPAFTNLQVATLVAALVAAVLVLLAVQFQF